MWTDKSLFGLTDVQWALQGCWLDDKWRPNLGTAPADMINPSDRRRRGCVRGAARKGVKLCSGYCCILSPRGNKVLIFRIQKDPLSWRFSTSSVCTFSIARHSMFASMWFCELKCLVTWVYTHIQTYICKCVVLWVEMSGDMSLYTHTYIHIYMGWGGTDWQVILSHTSLLKTKINK